MEFFRRECFLVNEREWCEVHFTRSARQRQSDWAFLASYIHYWAALLSRSALCIDAGHFYRATLSRRHVSVCVCLSHAGIVSKRLTVESRK